MIRKVSVFVTIAIILLGSITIYSLFREKSEVPVEVTVSEEEQLFQEAKFLYEKNQYDDALFMFEEFLGKYKDSPFGGQAAYMLGAIYENKDMQIEARKCYAKVTNQFVMDTTSTSQALARLGHLNIQFLFSTGDSYLNQKYEVKSGDNLSWIAKKYNTTVDLIMKVNGLENTFIHPGMQLVVLKGKFSAIADKSENILTVKLNENIFKVYKISTGKDDCSPVGTFTIINKIKDPTWFKQGQPIPPDDPRNILGTRWLGFSIKGYGIHGTTSPETIGTQETAGCIRMKNDEVEELYTYLPIGTEVTMIE